MEVPVLDYGKLLTGIVVGEIPVSHYRNLHWNFRNYLGFFFLFFLGSLNFSWFLGNPSLRSSTSFLFDLNKWETNWLVGWHLEMSEKNWAKGIKIPELNRERQKKAEEINDFLKDLPKTKNSGKAETGRLALDLAYQKIEELQEEEEEKRQDLAKYYRKVDEIAEEMKK
jgi:hypothetical protein